MPTCRDVGDLGDAVGALDVEHFGHHADARDRLHFVEDAQALFAEALEGVGAGPRLVSAGAHELYAESEHELRRLDRHALVLDRAWSGDNGKPSANAGLPDAEGACVRVRFARDQLVAGRYPDYVLDAGEHEQDFAAFGSAITGDSDGGPLRAGNDVGRVAELADPLGDRLDLVGGGASLHDDEHESSFNRSRACVRPASLTTPASAGVMADRRASRSARAGTRWSSGAPSGGQRSSGEPAIQGAARRRDRDEGAPVPFVVSATGTGGELCARRVPVRAGRREEGAPPPARP